MPRIDGIPGPHRFFCMSFDCEERPHVHVERENNTCKFWLQPLGARPQSRLSRSRAESDSADHPHPSRGDSGGMA
ncbi:MAG: DUF4160 domain-containing protein [Zetaproteobacteria bacterium]|nr:MAG: DUF4160 domain-containing protein [Zetaproteobacteria bacterium]